MKKTVGQIVFSPSDLVRYAESPFASWMDRYHLENPGLVQPDEETEDQKLIAQTGDQHERAVLSEFKASIPSLAEIPKDDFSVARAKTLASISGKAPIIYQAALESGRFAGYADFLIIKSAEVYQVWDTKLARSPKPHYAVQLCCYSEMLADMTGQQLPERFGIILGSKERIEFRVEDFIHYHRGLKTSFLSMQESFSGDITDRPEPLPMADHGRWTSYAERFFDDSDHLVRVAGITAGQIKKLRKAGVATLAELAAFTGNSIPKLAPETLARLISQARLQFQTRSDRLDNPDAPPRYEVLSNSGTSGRLIGFAALPPKDSADVFFDMEGYPLVPGGLEYLFGACTWDWESASLIFCDWWAHNREEEKVAFEGFVDWIFKRWRDHPNLHIYHYAAYEVNALRRLSTQHDTRQDEVDTLLRNEIFVDLYQIVRHALRIGEESYSIKDIEHLYRPRRSTEVTTAVDSIVRYAQWMESGQSCGWRDSSILKQIRDYNEDDCRSTAELFRWLELVAEEHTFDGPVELAAGAIVEMPVRPLTKELPPEVIARQAAIAKLRERADNFSVTLGDLLDFHRREEKPMWWRMFDRAKATAEELQDDAGCIQGISAVGSPTREKQSQLQSYRFTSSQECKLSADGKTLLMFSHNLEAKFTLTELDTNAGCLQIKIGNKTLNEKFGGVFPQYGDLIPYEYVPATTIQTALTEIALKHLNGCLSAPIASLLGRAAPSAVLQEANETTLDAAIRIVGSMSGDCLVIQGPPGTGKTYTAARVINGLLAQGKRVGLASNSHKAVVKLLSECGKAAKDTGGLLEGIKVGGGDEDQLFSDNPSLRHIETNKDARAAYAHGVVGGTAWLFALPEWEDALDFLFIDEAGQVSLANAVAMARTAKNLVLLGDQMQLEQPIQGSHPGDAGLSSLQYALKDIATSQVDLPVFHAVVPQDYGLFLGESRRMHPSLCQFISTSIYDGRLRSHPHCGRQRISNTGNGTTTISAESGVVFISIEHDGNIQQSDEEVARTIEIYKELLGRPYTDFEGTTRPLVLSDFLFIAPYNAQVRALQSALPMGARVGSVDKFQGQEAPVCILSLCSSFGEYGSRGLAFILDRNRVNVAISRSKCLAVVVADPRMACAAPSSISQMMLINLFSKITNEGNYRLASSFTPAVTSKQVVGSQNAKE